MHLEVHCELSELYNDLGHTYGSCTRDLSSLNHHLPNMEGDFEF